MKKNLSARLSFAMNLSGVTQGILAERVGVSQPSIWKLVAGKTNSSRKLVEIAHALNVRPEWLATGEEPMWNKTAQQPYSGNSEISPREAGAIYLKMLDSSQRCTEEEVYIPYIKDIDLIGCNSEFFDDDPLSRKLVFTTGILMRAGAKPDGQGVLCFPISGDGMVPVMPDGSTLAINTGDRKIVDGKIYAISQNGWKRVKILYRTGPETLSLRSFNKDEHPDESVSLLEVEVIGRLIWWSVTC